MRDGYFPFLCLASAPLENDVPNHFELALLEYRPETPLCILSSLTCWSRFLEHAPPI